MSDNRGFTLVEVIIAIALLAVCSIYILEMFAVSDKLSDDSYLLDGAISNANNISEYLKASGSPDEFFSNPYIVMREPVQSGKYYEQMYFDSQWRQIDRVDGCSVILDVTMDFTQPQSPCVMALNYYSYKNGLKEHLFDMSAGKYFAEISGEAMP